MKKRITWLDCGKAFAILCVVEDHCSQILYPSKLQLYGSYVSVSLFILLSGISAYLAYFQDNDIKKQYKRLGKLFAQYAIATAVIYVVTSKYFNLDVYLDYLRNFNVINAFYFFAIIFQLSLVTPFLIKWCKFCDRQKLSILFHVVSLVIVLCLSILFYRNTYTFNIVGAGRYVLGASCFFIYYCGILLGKATNINVSQNIKKILIVAVVPLWFLWRYFFTYDILKIDVNFITYFGQGINPAGIEMMIFTGISLVMVYSIFSFLENIDFKIVKFIVWIFSVIGQNTIYIYMYHILIRDILQDFMYQFTFNPYIMRLTVYLPMIIIPIIFAQLIKKIDLT